MTMSLDTYNAVLYAISFKGAEKLGKNLFLCAVAVQILGVSLDIVDALMQQNT